MENIKSKGRPKKAECGKRVNIYIDKKHHEKAKKIGGGNFSLGVKKLIAAHKCSSD